MSRSIFVFSIVSFFLGLFVGKYFLVTKLPSFHKMNMDEKRDEFLSHKEMMVGEMLADSNYRCCLEKPCVYCIEKTPGHGEGATCNCLEDIVNGNHPCGECIGEILEGHGNKFLAEYFAEAIAEEVGMNYKETIKQIISDKYEISIEDQI